VTKRRMVAFGTLAALALALAWSAWTWWPPVLRFRLRQIDKRTNGVMLEYLDGKRDLASAAQTLAGLWKTGVSVGDRLPPLGQTAPIVDPGPPPGSDALDKYASDPRLRQLIDSAAQLSGLGWTMYRPERDST
jgi:hypothetical protein